MLRWSPRGPEQGGVGQRAMLPLYFGAPHRPLLGAYHPSRATHARSAVVVLCSPFGHEELHAYRAERHLAEGLARAGFGALRFDYDATGDSAGDDRESGRVAAWRASIVLAAEALRAETGIRTVVLVGLRAGALLALDAAREVGADGLVLWNPVSSGRAHVRELLRLHKMLVPRQKGDDAPREDAEALGFALRKDTAAELAKLDPAALNERPAPAALVLGGNDNPTEDKLLERLRTLGTEVEYKHLPGHPFLMTDPHKSTVPDEMIHAIVDFLLSRYPAEKEARRAGSSSGITGAVTSGELGEEAWTFGGAQARFGILSRPKQAGEKPAIVLMNAGSIHRVGPNRSFVRMARRWADLGYPVLRMDLSGIGDSPVAENAIENLPYPPGAVRDAQAAMDALAERGIARRFILTGLCSGADIAFRAGVVDPRVAGAWMINPQAFYFESSDALKAFMRADLQAQYYQSAVWDTGRWKRVLRGEVDLRRVASIMKAKVASSVKRRAARLLGGVLDGTIPPTKSPEAKDVIKDLRAMANRGTDTFLLCSEDDPGLLYLLKYFGKELDALEDLRGFRKEIVIGTDHTFTPLWSQDMLSDTLTAHLLKKHG
jgi:dienelactone hydrolase